MVWCSRPISEILSWCPWDMKSAIYTHVLHVTKLHFYQSLRQIRNPAKLQSSHILVTEIKIKQCFLDWACSYIIYERSLSFDLCRSPNIQIHFCYTSRITVPLMSVTSMVPVLHLSLPVSSAPFFQSLHFLCGYVLNRTVSTHWWTLMKTLPFEFYEAPSAS